MRACVEAGRKNRMSERKILLMMVGMLAVTVDCQREMMKPPPAKPVPFLGIVHDRPGIQLVAGTADAPVAGTSGGNG